MQQEHSCRHYRARRIHKTRESLLLGRSVHAKRWRWLRGLGCVPPFSALLLTLMVLLLLALHFAAFHWRMQTYHHENVMFSAGGGAGDGGGVSAPQGGQRARSSLSLSLCDALATSGHTRLTRAASVGGRQPATNHKDASESSALDNDEKADAASRHVDTRTTSRSDGIHANSFKLLLALVVRTEDSTRGHKSTAAAASMCAAATAAADMLRSTQTWFRLGRNASTRIATIVARPSYTVMGALKKLTPCPGASEASPSALSRWMQTKRRKRNDFDIVIFVDAAFVTRHRVSYHATTIEKMVLAASLDPSLGMLTIHPSSTSQLSAPERRFSGDGVCADSSTPYVRRRRCHFNGSPLLVRPQVIGSLTSGGLEGFLADTVLAGLLSRGLDAVTRGQDLLAPLFCSTLVGNENTLKVRALTEIEHLVLQDDLPPIAPESKSASTSSSSSSSSYSSSSLKSCAGIFGDLTRAIAGAKERAGVAAAAPFVGPSFQDHLPTSALHRVHAPNDRPGFMLLIPWLENGGADQFNVNLARRLTNLGVRMVVVTTEAIAHHPIASTFYAITPDVFHLDQLVSSSLHVDDPQVTTAALATLEYLVVTRNVQAVMISHSAYGYAILPRLRQQLLRPHRRRQGPSVSFVDYVHLVEPEWGNGGYAAASAANTEYLDHTFAASHQVAEWMRVRRQQQRQQQLQRRQRAVRKGVGEGPAPHAASIAQSQESRTSVAYIGVDTNTLRPLPDADRARVRSQIFAQTSSTKNDDGPSRNNTGATLPPPPPNPQPVVIAYIARMVDQKLPEVYFEILRMLRLERNVDNFVSLAIGDGDRLGELRANLSRHPKLERSVRTYGMLDHDASMRLLAASDILLLPSRNEGVSLAVYEAMALGVMPVVSAVGGQCELVADGAGACIAFDADAARSSPEAMRAATTPFVDELERLIVDRSRLLLIEGRRATRARVVSKFSLSHLVRGLHRGLCR